MNFEGWPIELTNYEKKVSCVALPTVAASLFILIERHHKIRNLG